MENGKFIRQEIDWLTQVIITRLKLYFNQETPFNGIEEITPQTANPEMGAYARFVSENALGFEERVYLALTIAPVLKPQLMDCFNIKNTNTDQRFAEFGCDEHEKRLRPSLETVLFLLAGDDIAQRIELSKRFAHHRVFGSQLFLNETFFGETNPVLMASTELIDRIIFEQPFSPHFSSAFPARRVSTTRSWEDLVLDSNTMQQINEIKLWLEYGGRLLDEWNLKGKIKNGYRTLFYGPSGTGKTFTATLLGKHTGREIYCVDLSMVVSKYVGETEKNLSQVFAMAEDRDWILFFDEADALFGKRTNVKDAHDRYANQEIAYLLQRVEDYRGLVVLSTNLKTNIDEAFARRFQSVVRFSMPNTEERLRLWQSAFSEKSELEERIELEKIATKYEITGGSILNVVQYCSLLAMSRGCNTILLDDLTEGIRREFRKEGKIVE